MGTWISKLFENDLACDIRDDYIDLLRAGRTDDQAEQELLGIHLQSFRETGDESVLWLALAITEWNQGRLSRVVQSKALEWIGHPAEPELWGCSLADYRYELDKIGACLLEPQPARRRIGKIQHIHAPWKSGDLLCMKLPEDMKKVSLFNGKYALLLATEIQKYHANRFESDDQGYDDVVCLDILNWLGEEPPAADIPLDSLRNFVFEVHSSRFHGPKYNCLKLHLFPGDEKLLQELSLGRLKVIRSDFSTSDSQRILCDGENRAWRATLSSLGNQVGLALHNWFVEAGNWNP